MLGVANARNRFGCIGRLLRGDLEELLGFLDQAFAKQGASDLEHQLHIVLITQLQCVIEAAERVFVLSEFQKGLAKAGERVLVIGIENQRFLEAASGPGVVLAGVVGVANPYMELHRVRIETESLFKYVQRLIILTFVVQLMCSLVVLFRTQKRCWHDYAPSEESSISLLYSLDTALFKVVTSGSARLR